MSKAVTTTKTAKATRAPGTRKKVVLFTGAVTDPYGEEVEVEVAIKRGIEYPATGSYSEHAALAPLPVVVTHRQIARDIANLLGDRRREVDEEIIALLSDASTKRVTLGPWRLMVQRRASKEIDPEMLVALGVSHEAIAASTLPVKSKLSVEALVSHGVDPSVIKAATKTTYGDPFLDVRKAKDAPVKAKESG